MVGQLILAGATFVAIFVLFLVLANTFNNTSNHLTKLSYLLRKEYDLRKETLAIKHLMEEQAAAEEEKKKAREEADQEAGG